MNTNNALTFERLNELLFIDAEKGLFVWKSNTGGRGKKDKEVGL